MANTAYLYPMSTPAATSPTQTTRPALRRATYVHVSDLLSAYNIDHARLEQELSRVKANREQVGGEIGTSTDGGVSHLQAKTPKGDTAGILGGEEGSAADLEAALPQKRLQPPRGGYNLCV